MNIPANTGFNDVLKGIQFFESIPEKERSQEDADQLAKLRSMKDQVIKGRVRGMVDQVMRNLTQLQQDPPTTPSTTP